MPEPRTNEVFALGQQYNFVSRVDLTIEELTDQGESFLFERIIEEVESTKWTEHDKLRFYSALELARDAHDGQTRGDDTRPFLAHPLGVTIVLISDQYMGVRDDPNCAIATLLHDGPEMKYAARRIIQTILREQGTTADPELVEGLTKDELGELSLHLINDTFGPDVATLVRDLTRGDYPEDVDATIEAERHKVYHKLPSELVERDPRAARDKLADNLHNALLLNRHEAFNGEPKPTKQRQKQLKHALKLVGKYRGAFEEWVYISKDTEHCPEWLTNSLSLIEQACAQLDWVEEMATFGLNLNKDLPENPENDRDAA